MLCEWEIENNWADRDYLEWGCERTEENWGNKQMEYVRRIGDWDEGREKENKIHWEETSCVIETDLLINMHICTSIIHR